MENIKVPTSIKALAIVLIIYGVFTIVTTLIAMLVAAPKHYPFMMASLSSPVILIIGGIGLIKLKKWSFWLIIVLLGLSFIRIFWDFSQVPALRTTAWITAYLIIGSLLLAIIIFLIKKKTLFN